MYSAELLPDSLAAARHSLAARGFPLLKKALDKVQRCWRALDKAQSVPYQVYETFPESLLTALQHCGSAITEHLIEHAARPDPALQTFFFEALHLQRMAEQLDANSLVDISKHQKPGMPGRPGKPGDSTICIRNLVPAPFLQPRLQQAHTSTLFSATLRPARYYADLLGLPADHLNIDVESPFAAAQLDVRIAGHISTRYPHRSASLAPIVELMARQFEQQRGNYLAFFSSYDYLQLAAERLAAQHPSLPSWRQARSMGEGEQREFLARFTESSEGIGFAVLGGSFAEGIDLPGRRLIGAFIATLGLPQINPVNEQVKQRMQTLFGAGYDYAYLYPGLQKVVQAAGRVIRTTSDRGVVHLIDDRFRRGEVQDLLPAWWALDR